jgi:hypothetical protein
MRTSAVITDGLSFNTDGVRTDMTDIAAILTVHDRRRWKPQKERLLALGGKAAKVVKVQTFIPKTTFLWEKGDIDAVVEEFRNYLRKWVERWSLSLSAVGDRPRTV